jgi:hypothetical protein
LEREVSGRRAFPWQAPSGERQAGENPAIINFLSTSLSDD